MTFNCAMDPRVRHEDDGGVGWVIKINRYIPASPLTPIFQTVLFFTGQASARWLAGGGDGVGEKEVKRAFGHPAGESYGD